MAAAVAVAMPQDTQLIGSIRRRRRLTPSNAANEPENDNDAAGVEDFAAEAEIETSQDQSGSAAVGADSDSAKRTSAANVADGPQETEKKPEAEQNVDDDAKIKQKNENESETATEAEIEAARYEEEYQRGIKNNHLESIGNKPTSSDDTKKQEPEVTEKTEKEDGIEAGTTSKSDENAQNNIDSNKAETATTADAVSVVAADQHPAQRETSSNMQDSTKPNDKESVSNENNNTETIHQTQVPVDIITLAEAQNSTTEEVNNSLKLAERIDSRKQSAASAVITAVTETKKTDQTSKTTPIDQLETTTALTSNETVVTEQQTNDDQTTSTNETRTGSANKQIFSRRTSNATTVPVAVEASTQAAPAESVGSGKLQGTSRRASAAVNAAEEAAAAVASADNAEKNKPVEELLQTQDRLGSGKRLSDARRASAAIAVTAADEASTQAAPAESVGSGKLQGTSRRASAAVNAAEEAAAAVASADDAEKDKPVEELLQTQDRVGSGKRRGDSRRVSSIERFADDSTALVEKAEAVSERISSGRRQSGSRRASAALVTGAAEIVNAEEKPFEELLQTHDRVGSGKRLSEAPRASFTDAGAVSVAVVDYKPEPPAERVGSGRRHSSSRRASSALAAVAESAVTTGDDKSAEEKSFEELLQTQDRVGSGLRAEDSRRASAARETKADTDGVEKGEALPDRVGSSKRLSTSRGASFAAADDAKIADYKPEPPVERIGSGRRQSASRSRSALFGAVAEATTTDAKDDTSGEKPFEELLKSNERVSSGRKQTEKQAEGADSEIVASADAVIHEKADPPAERIGSGRRSGASRRASTLAAVVEAAAATASLDNAEGKDKPFEELLQTQERVGSGKRISDAPRASSALLSYVHGDSAAEREANVENIESRRRRSSSRRSSAAGSGATGELLAKENSEAPAERLGSAKLASGSRKYSLNFEDPDNEGTGKAGFEFGLPSPRNVDAGSDAFQRVREGASTDLLSTGVAYPEDKDQAGSVDQANLNVIPASGRLPSSLGSSFVVVDTPAKEASDSRHVSVSKADSRKASKTGEHLLQVVGVKSDTDADATTDQPSVLLIQNAQAEDHQAAGEAQQAPEADQHKHAEDQAAAGHNHEAALVAGDDEEDEEADSVFSDRSSLSQDEKDAEIKKLRKAIAELQHYRLEGGASYFSAESRETIRDLEPLYNRITRADWADIMEEFEDGSFMIHTRRVMERRRHVIGSETEVARTVVILLKALLSISREKKIAELCYKHGIIALILRDLADPILLRAVVSPSIAKEHFVNVASIEMGILFDAIRQRIVPHIDAQTIDVIAKYVGSYSDSLRLTALLFLSQLSARHGARATEIVATRKDTGNAAELLQECMSPFVRGKRMRVNGFILQDLLESIHDLLIANRGAIASLLDTDFPEWARKILAAPELEDYESAGVSATFVSRKERYFLIKCLETMSHEPKARKAFGRKHPKIVQEMTKLAIASKSPTIQVLCSNFVWQVKFGDVHMMKQQVINSSPIQRSKGKWKK